MKGNVACCMDKFEEGITWFDKSIPLNPNDPDVHKNKGAALLELNRFEEALGCFEQSIELGKAIDISECLES